MSRRAKAVTAGTIRAECATIRIDKLLWYLRLASTRCAAQERVAAGYMRLDGRRIDKPGCAVSVGAILVFPTSSGVRSIRIDRLPLRRGNAGEAAAHYTELA